MAVSDTVAIKNPSRVGSNVAILITGKADPRSVQLLEKACQLSKLSPVSWERDADNGLPEVESPVIALGFLRPGERRVPSSVVQVGRAFPGLPVVMIAGEGLAREVIVLNRGQLSLVDPGVSVERLGGYLKRVLQVATRSPTVTFSNTYSRTLRPPGGWAASLSLFPSVREISEAELIYPWMNVDRNGFSSVIPNWNHVSRISQPLCEQLRNAVKDGEIKGAAERVNQVSEGGAMVLTVENNVMRLHVPQGQGGAWLLSPRRLPAVSQLLDQYGGTFQIETTIGDVFVLNTDMSWSPPEGGEWAEPIRLIRSIQETATSDKRPSATVIYEVC